MNINFELQMNKKREMRDYLNDLKIGGKKRQDNLHIPGLGFIMLQDVVACLTENRNVYNRPNIYPQLTIITRLDFVANKRRIPVKSADV